MAGHKAHDLVMDAIRGSTPCAIAARGWTPPATGAVIAWRRGHYAAATPQTPPRAESDIREARQPS